MNTNQGIQISGGTVTAGAMAAGHGATATNAVPAAGPASLEDLRGELHALVELLRARADVPADQVTVAELAEREAARPQPDKGSLLSYLQVLASGAGSIAAVGTAVTALQSAVTALL